MKREMKKILRQHPIKENPKQANADDAEELCARGPSGHIMPVLLLLFPMLLP